MRVQIRAIHRDVVLDQGQNSPPVRENCLPTGQMGGHDARKPTSASQLKDGLYSRQVRPLLRTPPPFSTPLSKRFALSLRMCLPELLFR